MSQEERDANGDEAKRDEKDEGEGKDEDEGK